MKKIKIEYLKDESNTMLEFHNLVRPPIGIFEFKNLTYLMLHRCNIKHIDKKINQLTNLKDLNLSGNKIKRINKNISFLINLNTLHLGDNKVKYISPAFYKLNKINEIALFNNPINIHNIYIWSDGFYKSKKIKQYIKYNINTRIFKESNKYKYLFINYIILKNLNK